jgi:hypothetical protein
MFDLRSYFTDTSMTLLHVPLLLYCTVLYSIGIQGAELGENYAINVPLHDGMDDESFKCVYIWSSALGINSIFIVIPFC